MSLPNIRVPLAEQHGETIHISAPWLLSIAAKLEWANPPLHTSSPGIQGQVAFDQNGYFYLCTSKSTWIRFGPGSSAF